MNVWFLPTWQGDLRLEPDPKNDAHTMLGIVKPTEHEKKVLAALQLAFGERGWIDDKTKLLELSRFWKQKRVVVRAPITEVGPVVVAIMKPGAGTLTAVKFKDGRVETCELHAAGDGPYRDPAKTEPAPEIKALAKKEDAIAAATVSRPTPSCPNCYADPSVNAPATDTLLAFLSEEEHAQWAKYRRIVVTGGLTGHRYMLAHRHSRFAIRNTRLCRDLDDDATMHFHDTSVPPEEEVLAAKLILEHREPWLRNEATCLGATFSHVFKNPFGDLLDGVPDANFTRAVGMLLGAGEKSA